MKKKLFSLALTLATALAASAQTGAWRAYMAYNDVQQIVKAQHLLFVRASNDLYSYNLNDHSITTYDKVTTLSDCNITHIGWNNTAKRLLIVYKNANLDFMNTAGQVVNLSSIYNHSMTQDKTVNRIDMDGQYAYLSCGFGIVKVNVQRCEVAESYILNQNILATGTDATYLYAQTAGGQVLRGQLGSNLIDPHNWTATTDLPQGVFDQDLSDYQEYLPTVQTLQPGGPKHNYFAFMRFKHGRLYTCGGGFNSADLQDLERPATIQVMDPYTTEWTFLQDDFKGQVDGTQSASWQFVDMMSVDADPQDPNHIFGGARGGLFEFQNGQLVNYYHKDNSPLRTVSTSNNYVLTESVLFDTDRNLWLLQSQVPNSLVKLETATGQFQTFSLPQLMLKDNTSHGALQGLFQDSRGLIWFVNNHYEVPSFYCFNPETEQLLHSFVRYFNEDGTSYGTQVYYPRHITEDLDGNIWISTSLAPMEIEAENVWTEGTYVTQPKIPRNDGTNYADYLLNGANVSCILPDAGNRKWIGTRGQGVYLISADNMQQLLHFTTENSPLLNDNIESMAWNEESGQLFIGTQDGLCAYFTDASVASIEMTKDNVYAFPNPVVSGYQGLITVRGLTRDADVKILTTSGQLVAQGRSNGGTFTWNGCDSHGRRVASGIYMVCTATSNGESGVVCKIAMIK